MPAAFGASPCRNFRRHKKIYLSPKTAAIGRAQRFTRFLRLHNSTFIPTVSSIADCRGKSLLASTSCRSLRVDFSPLFNSSKPGCSRRIGLRHVIHNVLRLLCSFVPRESDIRFLMQVTTHDELQRLKVDPSSVLVAERCTPLAYDDESLCLAREGK